MRACILHQVTLLHACWLHQAPMFTLPLACIPFSHHTAQWYATHTKLLLFRALKYRHKKEMEKEYYAVYLEIRCFSDYRDFVNFKQHACGDFGVCFSPLWNSYYSVQCVCIDMFALEEMPPDWVQV